MQNLSLCRPWFHFYFVVCSDCSSVANLAPAAKKDEDIPIESSRCETH